MPINIYSKISVFFISLTLLSITIDPTDNLFGIKKASFLCSIITLTLGIITEKIKIHKKHLLVPFLLLLVSSLAFFQGVFVDQFYSQEYAIYYASVFIPTILLPMVVGAKINFTKIFLNSTYILLFFLLSIITLTLLFQDFFAPFIQYFNYDAQVALIGYRTFGDILLPMIYWKTSVLLIILAGHLLKANNLPSLILFILTVFTIFISGTRANMLASISLIIVFLYYKINDNLSRLTKYAIITFLFLFLLTFVIYNINTIYDRFLSPDELSNSIKIGHFLSYLSLFESSLPLLIFGYGAGSGMFSIGTNEIGYSFELTYFELLRIYGILGALVIILILIYPLLKLKKTKSIYLFPWIIFIFVIGTNPLLLSSTGAFAIVFIYNYIFNDPIMKKNTLHDSFNNYIVGPPP